ELVQVQMFTGPGEGRAARARLAAWPRLQDCLALSSRVLNCCGAGRVPLRATVTDVSTAESGLDGIVSLLRRHGIRSYTRELAPPGSLISVMSTIAPGLERFSLVRLGLPVIPTGRGWSLWQARLVTG